MLLATLMALVSLSLVHVFHIGQRRGTLAGVSVPLGRGAASSLRPIFLGGDHEGVVIGGSLPHRSR